MLVSGWHTKRRDGELLLPGLGGILALRQPMGCCLSGCVLVGWMCGYRWHKASCQNRMASPSALDSGNPLQRMTLLSVCSDMQFSRAKFSRDANDQRQDFCFVWNAS